LVLLALLCTGKQSPPKFLKARTLSSGNRTKRKGRVW